MSTPSSAIAIGRWAGPHTANNDEPYRKAMLLATMLDATNDGVSVVDSLGRVQYWNAALERLTGWTAAEAIGKRTIDLIVTTMKPEERAAIGKQVMETGSALHEMTVTRRDGSAIDVEVMLTAHRDADGATYVISVVRDLYERNETLAELGRVVSEQTAVATSLSRLGARETIEATAVGICDEILASLHLDVAAIYAFGGTDHGPMALTLGVAAPAGSPVRPGQRLPDERARYLHDRAQTGPWVEEWHRTDDPYFAAWRDAGFDTGIYSPLVYGDQVAGLIIAGSRDTSVERLVRLIPSLLEYAAVASALLGPDLEVRRAKAGAAATIQRIISERAFRSVFQPVVELSSRTVVGYESLTRFLDGTPPTVRFAEAAAVGLAAKLEQATLEAAFEAAGPLPASAWLAVNCSPGVIADGVTLPRLLDRWAWLTVIEVTEHEAIADYTSFHRAVKDLGPRARLSVDDAGAGFASLRHILELGPQFVKLDMGLVRNVGRDPARQALIAGMVHFAAGVGCQLIAEGIETQAEMDQLLKLGVTLGQGYLLGRPAAAEDLVRPPGRQTGNRPAA